MRYKVFYGKQRNSWDFTVIFADTPEDAQKEFEKNYHYDAVTEVAEYPTLNDRAQTEDPVKLLRKVLDVLYDEKLAGKVAEILIEKEKASRK